MEQTTLDGTISNVLAGTESHLPCNISNSENYMAARNDRKGGYVV